MPLFLSVLLLLSSSVSVYADSPSVHIHGDERIVFSSLDQAGEGRFCVRHDSAGKIEKNWKVFFSPPAGGLNLKPANDQAESVPFRINVRPELAGRAVPVRHGDVLAQGSVLTSHCSETSDIFHLEVVADQAYDLIPGGLYSQTIRLRLELDGEEVQSFDSQLLMHVPEQVRINVAGPLALPDFDGGGPSVAKVDVCVFRNGFGHYAIRMRGDGHQGAYSLRSADRELTFQALWQSGDHLVENLSPGETSQQYRGDTYLNCRGRPNASLSVKVEPVHELGASAGHYQGLLRITVETR